MKTMRIDSVAIPKSTADARAFAIDLDGDRATDNNAGMVSGALHSQITGFDLSAAATARLANDVVWLIDVQDCDGEAMLASPAEMPISTLWDPAARFESAGWLQATSAALALEALDDGRWQGHLAMGFEPHEMIDAIVEPIAPYFDERKLFMEYLDVSPRDGRITALEMKNANVTKSLLAPDLDRGRLGTSFAIGFTAIEQPAN